MSNELLASIIFNALSVIGSFIYYTTKIAKLEEKVENIKETHEGRHTDFEKKLDKIEAKMDLWISKITENTLVMTELKTEIKNLIK